MLFLLALIVLVYIAAVRYASDSRDGHDWTVMPTDGPAVCRC